MSILDSMKILCVEDDAFAREEMIHFLKKRTAKVFSAEDGIDGLEQFDIHKPDITLVDLLMPKMDGLEMIREIRRNDTAAHIVIVTSVNSVDTVIEAVELGIDSYIVKPLDFTELELKLNKIADIIRAEQGIARGPLDRIKNKRVIEDDIKKWTTKKIREYTGKGPREMIVQIIGSQIKITILGGITTMEKNLIEDRKNIEMVKHQRRVAYEEMSKDISSYVGKTIGYDIGLDDIVVNLKKDMDQLIFGLQ